MSACPMPGDRYDEALLTTTSPSKLDTILNVEFFVILDFLRSKISPK